ncbi:leucine-rich repeat-containing protein 74B-like [Actinia tenebrosa]|uniref:Leucine-rich repeat-containing protein 74B-like n=1 Tax=Actinia tenebrosa TaxID=6105 RepID=A0A6P8I1A9_ACTTE|nr:leucine-rich repeat-containing protein 74B-like [Actinia tenebrosa]
MASSSKLTIGCIRHIPHTNSRQEPGEEEEEEQETVIPSREAALENSDAEYDTDLEEEPVNRKPEEDTSQGRGAYLKACKSLSLIPCSTFLRQLHRSDVNLKHYNLGTRGAEAVAVAMMQNTIVLSLNIAYNDIKEEGAIYISKMLTENFFITELDISFNDLRSQGAYAVAEMLRQNAELIEINLSGNKFIEKDVEPLVEAMKKNFTLKALNLSENEFCEVGGQLLGPGIDANVGLEYLNLSWNHIRRKGALAVAHGLAQNCSLKTLDISWNGFADDGAKAIGEALQQNSSLVELDISCNRISVYGAAQFAKGLAKNTTLQTLRVGKNPITSKGALDILNAVYINPDSAIEEICFDDVPVNAEFEKLLEDVLEARPNLIVQCGAAMKGKERVKKIKNKVDVLNLLLEYIELRGLRMVDFFRQLDKDGSRKLTRAEFMTGVRKAGIPMTRRQLKKLVNILDVDNDGGINYSEMVAIKGDDVFEIYHKKNLKKDDAIIKAHKTKQLKMKNVHIPL